MAQCQNIDFRPEYARINSQWKQLFIRTKRLILALSKINTSNIKLGFAQKEKLTMKKKIKDQLFSDPNDIPSSGICPVNVSLFLKVWQDQWLILQHHEDYRFFEGKGKRKLKVAIPRSQALEIIRELGLIASQSPIYDYDLTWKTIAAHQADAEKAKGASTYSAELGPVDMRLFMREFMTHSNSPIFLSTKMIKETIKGSDRTLVKLSSLENHLGKENRLEKAFSPGGIFDLFAWRKFFHQN